MTKLEYPEICEEDFERFHDMLNAYYREGEDADSPQETVDGFIRFLFKRVMRHEIEGCFAKEGRTLIGFGLWAVDTEDFAFSEMPGYGTIMEIGLTGRFRSAGRGREFVSYVESRLREKNITQCYVSAYGPARAFWTHCGYADSGKTAENGLPILVKDIGRS